MKINIKGTNLTLGDDLNNYLSERLSYINKLFSEAEIMESLLQVELARETTHHKQGDIFRAEFNFHHHGRTYRAVATESDIYTAIDVAKDELTQELKSDKERKQTLLRRGARQVKNFVRGFYKKNN